MMAQGVRTAIFLIFAAISFTQADQSTSDDTCGECVQYLTGVRSAVLSSMIDDDVHELTGLCDLVPSDSKDECLSLMDRESSPAGDAVLARVCDAVLSCSSTAGDQVDIDPLDFRSELETDKDVTVDSAEDDESSIFLCIICKKIMLMAKAFMANPARRARLVGALKLLCRFIPFAERQCNNLVNQYGSLIIDFLANYVNPGLCKTFRLCRYNGGSSYFNDQML